MDLNGPEKGMMQDREPTIRSRELGNRLRKAMLAANLSGKLLAEKLGWAQSTVSRLLAGKHFGKEADIAALLAVCGVIGQERHQLLGMAREAHVLGARVPKRFGSYARHQAGAMRVTEFQCVVVPELLQTPAYARAQIVAAGRPSPAVLELEVAARTARAKVFNGIHAPCFEFIVHEWLLRTPVGDRETMSDQLHHLLRVSVRPHISLRVVPIAIGAHASQAGSFGYLQFEEYAPAVHKDEENSDVYLEEPEEILTHRDVLTRLSAIALDEHQSRTVIAETINTQWT